MAAHRAWKCIPVFVLCIATCRAAVFYVDPVRGSMANNGSADSPWQTLQGVITDGLLESRRPASLPYDGSGALVAKNPGAPVKAGDTILCLSGYHGKPFIEGYYNAALVTVAAAPGHTPELGEIHFRAASNWLLRGFKISPSLAPSYSRPRLAWIESHGWQGPSSDIAIEQCTLYSVWDASAWSADEWNTLSCDGITISGTRCVARSNLLHNVNFGIALSYPYCHAEWNLVENFAGDGLRVLGNHSSLRYNLVRNCYAVNANHDDGVQSWTSLSNVVGAGVVKDILIEGNTILNYQQATQPFRGTLQGIGCFDGMFEGWTVRDNLVAVDHWHGISLVGATNCVLEHNTIFDQNKTSPGPPWLGVNPHKNGTPSSNVTVRDNLATSYNITAGQTVQMQNNMSITNVYNFFADGRDCGW